MKKTNGNEQRERELRLGPVKNGKKIRFFFSLSSLIAELKNWLSASEKSVAACTWKILSWAH